MDCKVRLSSSPNIAMLMHCGVWKDFLIFGLFGNFLPIAVSITVRLSVLQFWAAMRKSAFCESFAFSVPMVWGCRQCVCRTLTGMPQMVQ